MGKKFNFPSPSFRTKKFILWICKACVLGGVFFFFLRLSLFVTHPPLPSLQSPLLFYSNQTSDDLKILFQRAIQTAKHSLFLQIYGFSDPDLIHELKKASHLGVNVEVFYDPSGSGSLEKKIPFAFPLPSKGLMHKKILTVDDKLVFIGSTNLTPTSLRMHDNIVVGIYHPELAHFILHSPKNHLTFKLGNQQAEFWHLPDFQNQCLTSLIDSIEKAQSSIHLALFTFTHPKILQALIQAKKRGVTINVALDFYSAQGASKKTALLLKKEGISLKISQSGKLLHYKWGLIDQKTLFLGSANWTKSAFYKNEDCIFALHDLTPDQSKYFLKIWKKIEANSL